MSFKHPIYKKAYDISILLGGQHVDFPIPGVPPFSREVVLTLANDGIELSKLTMSSHVGTHIDAPVHLVQNGKTIDQYPIEKFIVPAQVVEIKDREAVRLSELQYLEICPGDALLFKTDNSTSGKCRSGICYDKWVYVTPEVADYCVEKKVSLIGIDYIAPEKPGGAIKDSPVHQKLFARDILVLENINLELVPAGRYTLFCLPLRIKGGEGSPVRAVLLQ